MEKRLEQLVERLKKALGTTLEGVILYGSAARGEHHAGYSDLNVLCVLAKMGSFELEQASPVVLWWRELGNPAPLFFTLEEIGHSADCFPIEFHDICESRRLLYGRDVFEGLVIRSPFYRVQVEHELRARFLRLRQKAAGAVTDGRVLLDLMAASVSTFILLARHALRVAGNTPDRSAKAALRQAAEVFGFEATPVESLLALREGRLPPRQLTPVRLLSDYLAQWQRLIAAVDSLDGGALAVQDAPRDERD